MGVKNNIIDKILADAVNINSDYSYTTKVSFIYKGYKPLSLNNQFNAICVWSGPQDERDNDNNDNSPSTRIMNCYIDYHAKIAGAIGTGEGNIDELIDSVEVDMFKWLFKSSTVTANKWLDLSGTTGAGQFILGNIVYTRNDESGIVLIQFPLKIQYQPQFYN